MGMAGNRNPGQGGLAGSANTAGPVCGHSWLFLRSKTDSTKHNSDLANKLDPRVDSDLDGSRNMGAATTGRTGAGVTGNGATDNFNNNNAATYNDPQSTNAGPVSSTSIPARKVSN